MGDSMDETIKKIIFNDIYKLIYEIKKCKSKSRYNTLYLDLFTLYDLCKKLEIEDYPELENYSNKSFEATDYKFINNFYSQILDDIDYHIEFTNNVNNIDEKKYDSLFYLQNIVSLSESVEYVQEFLNQYDQKLLKLFKKLRDNSKVLKIANNYEEKENNGLNTLAYTVSSSGSFTPYLVINGQENIADAINIIHEFGHCYDCINNKSISNKVFTQKRLNCLEEVYSFYLQNLFYDYLKSKKIYTEDINKSILGYNSSFLILIKELYKSLNSLKEVTFDSFSDELNYTYGILISYHFFDRYLIDPEKTKIEINDFLVSNGQYNMMDTLEKFNLKEELLDSKILRKYL